MTRSPGSGPSSGTISAQSCGRGPGCHAGVSVWGRSASLPSADGVTWTRTTVPPAARSATATAAACATTSPAGCGAVGAPTMPRCRSITTNAVRAGVSVRSISTLSSVSALLDVPHPTRTVRQGVTLDAPRGTRQPAATLGLRRQALDRRDAGARPKPGSVVRLLSGALRSGSASSARTRDGAERDVDDPALHGHVCTPVVPLENLREGRLQGAQLLVLLGLNGLDLRGVAEAFEQLAEPGLAFLRDLLPGREFPGLGRSHQLLGLRVADLHRTFLHLLLAELSGGGRAATPRSAEPVTCTSNVDERMVPAYTLCAGTPQRHGGASTASSSSHATRPGQTPPATAR